LKQKHRNGYNKKQCHILGQQYVLLTHWRFNDEKKQFPFLSSRNVIFMSPVCITDRSSSGRSSGYIWRKNASLPVS
jgi:hypothetical protein